MLPSKYLKAEDITVDEVVTIKGCREEVVGRDQGTCPVLYLEEYDRGICLNRTNAFCLADAYGDDEKRWTGKAVQLFTEMARNIQTGKMGAAIRMRPVVPAVTASAKSAEPKSKAAFAEEINDEIPF
jgi:hypothetical protein